MRRAHEEHGSGRGALKFMAAALQWRWSRSQLSTHLRRLGLKIRRRKDAPPQVCTVSAPALQRTFQPSLDLVWQVACLSGICQASHVTSMHDHPWFADLPEVRLLAVLS